MERLKFLAITASNLDEFVGSARGRSPATRRWSDGKAVEAGPDGRRTPQQVLTQLAEKIHEFVKSQYDCWREELVPALAEESIRIVPLKELSAADRAYIVTFYLKSIEPLLTPVTVDPAAPVSACV